MDGSKTVVVRDDPPTRHRLVRRWHWWHRWTVWSAPFPAGTEGVGILVAAITMATFRQRRTCRHCARVDERKVSP